jgi:magnesium-transporting ATPase (P-type)
VHGPDHTAVTILARHHFSSTLKRMSVVVSVEVPRGHDGAHTGVAMALLKVRLALPR